VGIAAEYPKIIFISIEFSLAAIGDNAFQSSLLLEDAYFECTEVQWEGIEGTHVFEGCASGFERTYDYVRP